MHRGESVNRKKAQTTGTSNSENFDKAILSFSSAGLIISLTCIKDIVPINEAIKIGALEISWWLFISAIISTVRKQLEYTEKYYLDGEEGHQNRRPW